MRLVGCLLSAVALIGSALIAQQPSPAFRAAVDVVALNVSVLDAERRYVRDLDQSDFGVFEDGVKQDLTFFTPSATTDCPLPPVGQ